MATHTHTQRERERPTHKVSYTNKKTGPAKEERAGRARAHAHTNKSFILLNNNFIYAKNLLGHFLFYLIHEYKLNLRNPVRLLPPPPGVPLARTPQMVHYKNIINCSCVPMGLQGLGLGMGYKRMFTIDIRLFSMEGCAIREGRRIFFFFKIDSIMGLEMTTKNVFLIIY